MEELRIGRVNIGLAWMAAGILKILGWKVQGPAPEFRKYIAVFAPHTSYWDAPLAVLMTFVLRIKGNWLVKDSMCRGPLGGIFRATGAIPVERSKHHNMVDQVVKAFEEHDQMILALAPEGTRRHTDHWKSGFYYIALKAKLPIVLAFFDHKRKVVGNTGVVLYPSGNVEADLDIIRNVYAAISPRHPEWRSFVQFRSTDINRDENPQ